MSKGLAAAMLLPRGRLRWRYDRVDRAAVRGGLGWSLLDGANRDCARERRADARVAPQGLVCRLGWRRWLSTRRREVLIVNISRGGALVFLDEPLPRRQRLWLELESPRRQASIPARVLDVRRTRSGQAAVRIAFSRRWPYDLFDAAVCGLPRIAPRSRPHAPGCERADEYPQDRSNT